MAAKKPISDETITMFTDLFRLILPDVNPNTQSQLAPGELGINYDTGVFYFRDPRTLEIRNPNSSEVLSLIEEKLDLETHELTADKIAGMRFYTKISQITGSDDITTATIDTIIAQMVYPSILYAAIETDDYETIGFPAASGLIYIIKSDENRVAIRFFEQPGSLGYTGHYLSETREFTYWMRDEDTLGDFAIASGDGLVQNVTTPNGKIADLHTLAVKVTNDVQGTATWNIDDYTPSVLYDVHGVEIGSALFKENTTIVLIRDDWNDHWVLGTLSKSVVFQSTEIMLNRLGKMYEDHQAVVDAYPALVEELHNLEQSTSDNEQSISEEMNEKFEVMSARVTALETLLSNTVAYDNYSHIYTFTSTTNIAETPDDFDITTDILLVNVDGVNQRVDIDYTLAEDGKSITFIDRTFASGDTLEFITLKYKQYVVS